MASQRQIEANRRNAENSTGPKTEEGKAASRRNGLQHGMAGAGAVLPGEAQRLVLERMENWRGKYNILDDEDELVFEHLVINFTRVETIQRTIANLRDLEASRAVDFWDDDRRIEAEEIARNLARAPMLTVLKLRGTKQGCQWMLERWERLGEALQSTGAWSEAERALAFDLLGVPAEDRERRDPWHSCGSAFELAESRRDILKEMISGSLNKIDTFTQESAADGIPMFESGAMRKLLRYEAACLRRYQWAKSLLSRQDRRSPKAAEQEPPARPDTPGVETPGLEWERPVRIEFDLEAARAETNARFADAIAQTEELLRTLGLPSPQEVPPTYDVGELYSDPPERAADAPGNPPLVTPTAPDVAKARPFPSVFPSLAPNPAYPRNRQERRRAQAKARNR